MDTFEIQLIKYVPEKAIQCMFVLILQLMYYQIQILSPFYSSRGIADQLSVFSICCFHVRFPAFAVF